MLVVAVVLVEPLKVGAPRFQRPSRWSPTAGCSDTPSAPVDLGLRYQPHRLFDHGFGVESGENLRHLCVQLNDEPGNTASTSAMTRWMASGEGLPLRLTATSITRSF